MKGWHNYQGYHDFTCSINVSVVVTVKEIINENIRFGNMVWQSGDIFRKNDSLHASSLALCSKNLPVPSLRRC